MLNKRAGRSSLCLFQPRLCPWGRFRALGTEGQGEPSDRERCGAILSQVLGAKSPLCHLGATQVGVCVQGDRQGWKGRGAFWDKQGPTQDLVVLLGDGEIERGRAACVPGILGE